MISGAGYRKSRMAAALLVPALAAAAPVYGQTPREHDKSATEMQYSSAKTIGEILKEGYPAAGRALEFGDFEFRDYPAALEARYKDQNGQNSGSKIKRGNWFKRNWEYFAWLGAGFGAGMGVGALIKALRDDETVITVGRIDVGPPR